MIFFIPKKAENYKNLNMSLQLKLEFEIFFFRSFYSHWCKIIQKYIIDIKNMENCTKFMKKNWLIFLSRN